MAIQLHSNAPAIMTNVLFNSPNYYVAEVSQGRSLQGFEVVDKHSGRGAFLVAQQRFQFGGGRQAQDLHYRFRFAAPNEPENVRSVLRDLREARCMHDRVAGPLVPENLQGAR